MDSLSQSALDLALPGTEPGTWLDGVGAGRSAVTGERGESLARKTTELAAPFQQTGRGRDASICVTWTPAPVGCPSLVSLKELPPQCL